MENCGQGELSLVISANQISLKEKGILQELPRNSERTQLNHQHRCQKALRDTSKKALNNSNKIRVKSRKVLSKNKRKQRSDDKLQARVQVSVIQEKAKKTLQQLSEYQQFEKLKTAFEKENEGEESEFRNPFKNRKKKIKMVGLGKHDRSTISHTTEKEDEELSNYKYESQYQPKMLKESNMGESGPWNSKNIFPQKCFFGDSSVKKSGDKKSVQRKKKEDNNRLKNLFLNLYDSKVQDIEDLDSLRDNRQAISEHRHVSRTKPINQPFKQLSLQTISFERPTSGLQYRNFSKIHEHFQLVQKKNNLFLLDSKSRGKIKENPSVFKQKSQVFVGNLETINSQRSEQITTQSMENNQLSEIRKKCVEKRQKENHRIKPESKKSQNNKLFKSFYSMSKKAQLKQEEEGVNYMQYWLKHRFEEGCINQLVKKLNKSRVEQKVIGSKKVEWNKQSKKDVNKIYYNRIQGITHE